MPAVRPWLRRTTGGLPATYWWLWVGTLVNRLGAFVVPFLAFYLVDHLHFSVRFTGFVLSLMGGASAVGAVTAGVLADRVGRRATLFAAQIATAVATLGLGFARSAVQVALLATALGFASNAVRPAFSAMIADLVPAEDRVRAYSLNYWAINLGFAVAPVIAGVLAGHTYLALFVGDAATTALVAVGVTLRVPETRPAVAAADVGAPSPGGLGVVLRDRAFMTFIGLTVLVGIVFVQHQVALPVAMRHDGLSPATYGALLAINGLLIVVVQLPATRWFAGRRRSRVLAGAALLMGLGFALTAVADTAPVYALTIVIWTLGEIGNAPMSTAIVADLAPATLRGRYQGMFTLAWSMAAFLGPGLGGVVLDRAGATTLWLACGVAGVVAAAGHLLAAGPRARRLAARVPEVPAAPAVPIAATGVTLDRAAPIPGG